MIVFPGIWLYVLMYVISLNLNLTAILNEMISTYISIIKICGVYMTFTFLNCGVDGIQYFGVVCFSTRSNNYVSMSI